MEIKVQVKSVYGTSKIYPANAAAETLAQIAGTKTLSPAILQLAKQLGMVITEVSAPQLAALVQGVAA